MPDVTLTSMLPDPKMCKFQRFNKYIAELDVVSDYFLNKFA